MATTVAASGGADGSVGVPTCGTAARTKPHRGGQVGNGSTQNGFAMGGGHAIHSRQARPHLRHCSGWGRPPPPPFQELPPS